MKRATTGTLTTWEIPPRRGQPGLVLLDLGADESGTRQGVTISRRFAGEPVVSPGRPAIIIPHEILSDLLEVLGEIVHRRDEA